MQRELFPATSEAVYPLPADITSNPVYGFTRSVLAHDPSFRSLHLEVFRPDNRKKLAGSIVAQAHSDGPNGPFNVSELVAVARAILDHYQPSNG